MHLLLSSAIILWLVPNLHLWEVLVTFPIESNIGEGVPLGDFWVQKSFVGINSKFRQRGISFLSVRPSLLCWAAVEGMLASIAGTGRDTANVCNINTSHPCLAFDLCLICAVEIFYIVVILLKGRLVIVSFYRFWHDKWSPLRRMASLICAISNEVQYSTISSLKSKPPPLIPGAGESCGLPGLWPGLWEEADWEVHLRQWDGPNQQGTTQCRAADRDQVLPAGQAEAALGHLNPRHPEVSAGRMGRRDAPQLHPPPAASGRSSRYSSGFPLDEVLVLESYRDTTSEHHSVC